jgi:hypothetical protein
MLEYRAFIFREDDHIVRALEPVCSSEESAKEHATQLVDGHDVELWQGDRKIETFGSRNVR